MGRTISPHRAGRVILPAIPEYTISYGKAGVPVYRHGALPLSGVRRIPESPFEGRPNAIVASEVTVEVFGVGFLASYTQGDNSAVVATDSIKNLILRESGTWEGATRESLLHWLGSTLLREYPQMESLRMSTRELRLDAATGSGNLFGRVHGEHEAAVLDLEREGDGVRIARARTERRAMELMKLTGSAFTSFVRDGYTTLPDRRDRPLFIGLDVSWSYTDPTDCLARFPERYVASEQVRDLCVAVFDDLVSESIQHLVHEMGLRALDRFPEIDEIAFVARNMTRDPVADGVYTDPFPAFGTITLAMRR